METTDYHVVLIKLNKANAMLSKLIHVLEVGLLCHI